MLCDFAYWAMMKIFGPAHQLRRNRSEIATETQGFAQFLGRFYGQRAAGLSPHEGRAGQSPPDLPHVVGEARSHSPHLWGGLGWGMPGPGGAQRLASATVSAVMLTMRRTVLDAVRMCTGLAAPSKTGPMAMLLPAVALSRL